VRTFVAGMIIALLTSTASARTRRAWEAARVARAAKGVSRHKTLNRKRPTRPNRRPPMRLTKLR
jgi:hypothetical protein